MSNAMYDNTLLELECVKRVGRELLCGDFEMAC
jgi:hypothetical protein